MILLGNLKYCAYIDLVFTEKKYLKNVSFGKLI